MVLDLARRLEGKKYHLYFDNFFSAVSLLDALLGKGHYTCGTARQNYRDFPDALKMNGKSQREMNRHGQVTKCMSNILIDLVTDVFTFDVEIHRLKKARGNDKLPSVVESRPKYQQTSTPDTEPHYKRE